MTLVNVPNFFSSVLCLIYGNESWNGRSSYLNIKMENDDNALLMGIDVIEDMQCPAWVFQIFHQRRNENL